MSKFKFTNLNDAITFASSADGAHYIEKMYVGQTANQSCVGHFISLYGTPEAAALAALANCDEDELARLNNEFSVAVVRCDYTLIYGADTWHNNGMTHTDRDGFIKFLKGNDWTDSDWIEDVYDLEVNLAGCKPSSLKFNLGEPWDLNEARAIAAYSDEALCSPDVYYQSAQPRVIELDDGEAMVIIFNHGAPVKYGVLDAAGLEALREDVRDFQLADIDYSRMLYGGLERCYYTSHQEA